jgi:hypothetical protein
MDKPAAAIRLISKENVLSITDVLGCQWTVWGQASVCGRRSADALAHLAPMAEQISGVALPLKADSACNTESTRVLPSTIT